MTLAAAFSKISEIESKLDLILSMLGNLQTQSKDEDKQTKFDEFAQYYFDNFRWRRVSPETKIRDLRRYKKHILPAFGDVLISDITPRHCQHLVDSLYDKQKTAHEVLSLLSVIFKAAIKHRIIESNPCDVVFIPEYEKKHGSALTKNEERELLAATRGTPYQAMFAVALYTGLRPNEYKTARIENGFIVAKNSKQKDGKEHKKKIPITSMLEPYLAHIIDSTEPLPCYCLNRLRERFKRVFPNHKLYDLRTMFYTRCQECGVSDVARKLFVGHSLGGLADTYTDENKRIDSRFHYELSTEIDAFYALTQLGDAKIKDATILACGEWRKGDEALLHELFSKRTHFYENADFKETFVPILSWINEQLQNTQSWNDTQITSEIKEVFATRASMNQSCHFDDLVATAKHIRAVDISNSELTARINPSAIRNCIVRGGNIEILFLDSDGKYTPLREQEENLRANRIKNITNVNIETALDIRNSLPENKENVSLYIYDKPPRMNMIFVDDYLILQYYSNNIQGINNPSFFIEKQPVSPVYEFCEKSYEYLKSESTPLEE